MYLFRADKLQLDVMKHYSRIMTLLTCLVPTVIQQTAASHVLVHRVGKAYRDGIIRKCCTSHPLLLKGVAE